MHKNLNMTFKVPNSIITDQALQLSSRVLLITLYSCCNRYRVIENKSVRSIAGLAGLSTRCVVSGLRSLEASGYIRKRTYKRYDRETNRVINSTSSYYLVRDTKQNYTKLPRDIFNNKDGLTAADFCVVAYLHMLGAKARRAFPSKAQIAQTLGIAKSTVAVTLRKISSDLISTLLLRHCRRNRGNKGGDFAANSYHIVIDTTTMQVISSKHPKEYSLARTARIASNRFRQTYRKAVHRVCQPIISLVDCHGQICLCLDTNYYNRQRRKRQYRPPSGGCPKNAQQELQT